MSAATDRDSSARRWKIAWCYAAGAVAMAAITPLLGWWGLLTGWIAATLIVMWCGYAFAGPAIYGKKDGRIPLTRRLLLAPHMLGTRLVRECSIRRSPEPCHEIVPRLWLGGFMRNRGAAPISRSIAAVLDLTAEHTAPDRLRALHYKNVPVLDMLCPTLQQLRECVTFIEAHDREGVLVFCGLGRARSPVAVAAYLLASGQAASVSAACDIIHAARPCVRFKPHHRATLHAFLAELSSPPPI